MKSENIQLLIVDLFCGAGGWTEGNEQAEVMGNKVALVIAAVNHDENAIESHAANHPDTKHFFEDIRTLKMAPLVAHVRKMQAKYPEALLVLHASLECTNFSKAKGGKPRNADSRTLADHMDRYVEALLPDYVTIENVVEFMSWGPLDGKGKPLSRKAGLDYMKWRNRIKSYGYYDDWKELNSANYGAYTSRNRLFGIFAKHGLPIAWPEPTHAKATGKATATAMFTHEPKKPWVPVREVLDLNDKGESIFTRKKPLSEKTMERIYAGLIKFVGGGKVQHDAFMSKYHGGKLASKRNRNFSTDEPLRTLDTQNRHAVVQPEFITKYFSGKPDGKNISVDGPAGTIKTIDGQAIVSAEFIQQRNTGNPDNKVISIEQPARTITQTGGNQELVQAEFLQMHYGNGFVSGTDKPCPTLTTKDRCGLVSPQYIMRDFSNGDNTHSIDKPGGALMPFPKMNLVSPEFITSTNFDGVQKSVDETAPTITADRHYHYLVNPQYANQGGDIDRPCFTLIARMDKMPPYLVEVEGGGIAIEVLETDSEFTKKIKEFMAMYGIIDIRMRMLRILELLKIQGFPADYKLIGTQAEQKKYIGNSVVPIVSRRITEALAKELINHVDKAA